MAKKFEPATPIEQAIYKGDCRALLQVARALSPAERALERASVVRMRKLIDAARYSTPADNFKGWGSIPTDKNLRAVAVASILCGTADDVAETWYDTEEFVALAREFSPPTLPEVNTALMKSRGWQWHIHDVQRLISVGLSPRPACDEYALGLMLLFSSQRQRVPTFKALFAEDPGLKDVLLRILEVEGTQDVSLTSVDKYVRSGKSWAERLVELSEQGVYTRAVLIDKALSALERGWIQYRSGWFSAFHELLAPTVKEMRPHAPRYLALLGSRIPPTVTFALNCVGQLEAAGELARPALLAALPPVFASAVKGQIATGLKLLDRCVKAEPALAADAARLIVPALAHENAQMQAAVLERLETWDQAGTSRASLGSYASGIAAVNREAFRKLTGKSSAAAPSGKPTASDAVPATRREPVSPVDERFALQPVATLDEAIELTAYSLENDADIEALERAIAGLVRFAPFDETTRKRFAAVSKRATKARKPMSAQFGRLVVFLATGQAPDSPHVQDAGGHRNEVQLSLGARLDELMAFVTAGAGVPVLAEPTHRRGFIAPIELVARLAAQQAKHRSTGPRDFVTALMRLAPGDPAAALTVARGLADDAHSRALRHVLGDDVKVTGPELAAVARRMRVLVSGKQPPSREWKLKTRKRVSGQAYTSLEIDPPASQNSKDPVATLERVTSSHKPRYWCDVATTGCEDEGSIVYYAMLLPAEVENFCADGAASISMNIDWWQAHWEDKAYLRTLLEPTAAMGSMATLLLSLALAGKEAGQTAVAVDVLVAAQVEGRLDTGLLASSVGRLIAGGHAACARYAKSLGAARRIDVAVSSTVADVVFAVVALRPKDPPKDLAALLELVLEIVIAQELAIPAQVRPSLEALEIGGKGAALKKKLLARP